MRPSLSRRWAPVFFSCIVESQNVFIILCVYCFKSNMTHSVTSTAPRIIMLVGGCGRSTALCDKTVMAKKEEAESCEKTKTGTEALRRKLRRPRRGKGRGGAGRRCRRGGEGRRDVWVQEGFLKRLESNNATVSISVSLWLCFSSSDPRLSPPLISAQITSSTVLHKNALGDYLLIAGRWRW